MYIYMRVCMYLENLNIVQEYELHISFIFCSKCIGNTDKIIITLFFGLPQHPKTDV